MNQRYRIVIVGGGMTGLMSAALLARDKTADRLDITLLDAAPRPVFSPAEDVALRVSAISTGSAGLFDTVGAWDYVAETRASPYEKMRVWDANDTPDGDASLQFDAAEFAVPQLGFIVENLLLQEALLRQLDDGPVQESTHATVLAPSAELTGSPSARPSRASGRKSKSASCVPLRGSWGSKTG